MIKFSIALLTIMYIYILGISFPWYVLAGIIAASGYLNIRLLKQPIAYGWAVTVWPLLVIRKVRR